MTELLTAAQMRAIEQAAIASGEVTGLELMERAGRGVVEAIFEEWPELRATSHRAVVLCGPGNNGGDGFVVARLLKEWGWEVEVFLYGDPAKLPPDARVNCERWRGMGEVIQWNDVAIEDRIDEGSDDLLVDALFGTGLSRVMPDDTERTWHGIMPKIGWPVAKRTRFVAVDIPSGLCSDSGRNLQGAFPADLTVTFHRAKIGHFLQAVERPEGGALWCGRVAVRDIGLRGNWSSGSVRHLTKGDLSLRKFPNAHKYAPRPRLHPLRPLRSRRGGAVGGAGGAADRGGGGDGGVSFGRDPRARCAAGCGDAAGGWRMQGPSPGCWRMGGSMRCASGRGWASATGRRGWWGWRWGVGVNPDLRGL